MKHIIALSLCLLCLVATTTLVFAQSSQTDGRKNEAKTAAKIRKLGTGDSARVKVKLYNGSKYEGTIKSSTDSNFILAERSGNEQTLTYSDIRSVEGSGLSKGAKIGIGVGAAAGATLLVIYLAFKHVTRNN